MLYLLHRCSLCVEVVLWDKHGAVDASYVDNE